MKSITVQYVPGNTTHFVFYNDTESSINNTFAHVRKGEVIGKVMEFIRTKEMAFTDKVVFKPLNEAATICTVTEFLENAIELLIEKKGAVAI